MNYRQVISNHSQHYVESCVPSGMELLLKLHSLVSCDFRKFQDKYTDENIGFGKLADLEPFGVTAKAHELPIDEGFSIMESELDRGHFPLLSLPSPSGIGWHIWVAVREDGSLRFLSREFENPEVLQIGDLNKVRQDLVLHRQGKINFVTYELRSQEEQHN